MSDHTRLRGLLIGGRFLPPIAGGSETYNERLDRELNEFYGAEVRQLDQAAAAVERARKETFRADGVTRLYGPEELAEREARALAAYDARGAEIVAAVERAVAEAEQELVKLEGASPLDRLSEAELARANARREFVREDAAELPPDVLAQRIRAALVAGDKADLVLWDRYAGKRVAALPAGQNRLDLATVLREVEERLADPKARERREKATRKREVGKVLASRVQMRRRELDGSAARALAEAGRMMRL